MQKEIEDIINANLPAQVGEVLKKRLEQAEVDAKTVESQRGELERKSIEIKGLKEFIDGHTALNLRELAIQEREFEVEKKERAIEVFGLQIKLEEANKRAELVAGFTQGLVRNIEFRKEIFDSETLAPFIDGNGNWQYPQPTSKMHTETQKSE